MLTRKASPLQNRAGSGAAARISGRAGLRNPDTSAQNWQSAIAATWTGCIFYRNWGSWTGALLSTNVWPITFAFIDSSFVKNSISLSGNSVVDDFHGWGSLADQGNDVRVGFSSILHSGTRYVGGFKSDGLVSAIYS